MRIKIKRKLNQDKVADEQIISYLLADRGIEDIDNFLRPPHPLDIPFADLFSGADLEIIVDKLQAIREKGGRIVVYTDYDADGITGGAVMWETLHLLGFDVMPYVPHRQHEGYGFSQKGIDAVKKKYDPSLIISVDHGIAAADKIAYAKKLGIPIVITDHHLRGEKPPDEAYAVFHTDKLSGAGVAYFFARELFRKLKIKNPRAKVRLENNFARDYLALAAIGTVADLVPLVGPARSIVKHGLAAFPSVSRVGIRHILKEAGIEGRPITPYEIGFIIAPRINAVGRLTHALDALRLLCTQKSERAATLAGAIGNMNRQRQDLVEQAVGEAMTQVKSTEAKGKRPKVIVLISDKWHEGIIGLIAAKLTEQFYRPAIVMTAADGFYKGSARSVLGFDITAFLRSQQKYLLDVGGHRAAAGFTIEKDKTAQFIEAAEKQAEKLIKETDLTPTMTVDMALPLSSATLALVESIDELSPFGIGNPQPTFYSEGRLAASSLFGKKRDHLKLKLDHDLEAVFFNKGEDYFKLASGANLGVVYNLEIDRFYKERVRLRGRFVQSLT